MYIANYLRVHAATKPDKSSKAPASAAAPLLSSVDVFHQMDADRDELLNVFEYEKALELLGVHAEKDNLRVHFPKNSSTINLDQFKSAWLQLVDVRSELEKRDIPISMPSTASTIGGTRAAPAVIPEPLSADNHIQPTTTHSDFDANERGAARTPGEDHTKKERVIKERQAKEERRLLHQIAIDAEKRKAHQMQAIQEHMASKMDKIVAQKAKCGDDVINLCGQKLKELPASLFRGRDALNTLSSLLILDLSKNRLQSLPGAMFAHLFTLQTLNVSDSELGALPVEIGEVRDLQVLDLHSNQLHAVPRPDQASPLSGSAESRVQPVADLWRMLRRTACVGRVEFVQQPTGIVVRIDWLSVCASNPPFTRKPEFESVVQRVATTRRSHLMGFLGVWTETNRKRRVWSFAQQSESAYSRTQYAAVASERNRAGETTASAQCEEQSPDVIPSTTLRVDRIGRFEREKQQIGTCSTRNWVLAGTRVAVSLDNRLQKVPMEMGALVKLEELNLSWNEITELPEEIGCLVSLRTVNLSHNRISHLPDAIVLWQSLETLSCSHNWLTTPLTSSLRELQALRYIDLSQNQLTQLEPCIYKLENLEVLNLASNHITFLPKEVTTATCMKLRKLDLYTNRLVALPVEMAELLPRLDVLSIERNPMKYLPEKWSDHWRLENQYKTAFAKGYTQAEVKEWVHDQSICYPVIVSVWKQLVSSIQASSMTTRGLDLSITGKPDVQQTMAQLGGSDAFVETVQLVMESDHSWQPRFQRIVRHYFYEFKHLGHAVIYDDISFEERAENAAVESELHELYQRRATDAID